MKALFVLVLLASCAMPSAWQRHHEQDQPQPQGEGENVGGDPGGLANGYGHGDSVADVQITIPAAKAASCQAQGGCGLLSLDQLRSMLKQAHDEGAAEALEGLDSQGRKRGAT